MSGHFNSRKETLPSQLVTVIRQSIPVSKIAV